MQRIFNQVSIRLCSFEVNASINAVDSEREGEGHPQKENRLGAHKDKRQPPVGITITQRQKQKDAKRQRKLI